MRCVIIDSCDNALQRVWLNKLVDRLEQQGHSTFVRPAGSHLHHESLQMILDELEFDPKAFTANEDELVAIIEQDCWPFDNWHVPIEAMFKRNLKLAAVGAQHCWRDYNQKATAVVRSRDRGQMRPLPGNLAAWFTVLHPGRMSQKGLFMQDLDWCADGFRVTKNEHGFWVGGGGDTGCRVSKRIADLGLDVTFLPTRIWPGTSFGGLVSASAGPGEEYNQQWIVYHHFYGRSIGKRGELNVGHHRLMAEDVTSCALKFMSVFMGGVD